MFHFVSVGCVCLFGPLTNDSLTSLFNTPKSELAFPAVNWHGLKNLSIQQFCLTWHQPYNSDATVATVLMGSFPGKVLSCDNNGVSFCTNSASQLITTLRALSSFIQLHVLIYHSWRTFVVPLLLKKVSLDIVNGGSLENLSSMPSSKVWSSLISKLGASILISIT